MTRPISAALVFVILAPVGAGAQPQSTASLAVGAHGNVLAAIQGNALSAANNPLTAAAVRVRDVRFGRIITSGVTDKAGLFAFRGPEPASYIVELVGTDRTVRTARQIVNVNGG